MIASALYADVRSGSGDSAYPRSSRDSSRRLQGSRARRNVGGAHELARVGVQLVLHAAHVDVYRKLRPNASEARLVEVTRRPSSWWVSVRLDSAHEIHLASSTSICRACRRISRTNRRASSLSHEQAAHGPGRGDDAGVRFVLGALRLASSLEGISDAGRRSLHAGINFLHFAALLFLLSTVLVVVSLPPPPECGAGKRSHYSDDDLPASAEATDERRWNIVASVVLVVTIEC